MDGQLFMQFSELADEQQQYWVNNTLWKSIPLESVFTFLVAKEPEVF